MKFIDVQFLEHNLAESERYVSNTWPPRALPLGQCLLHQTDGGNDAGDEEVLTEASVTAQQKHHPSPLVLTPWTSH